MRAPLHLLIGLLLAVTLVSVTPAYADDADEIREASAACNLNRDVPVNIMPRFDEPAYDYTYSVGEISRMAADYHHSIHEAMTFGLTQYEPLIQFNAPIKSIRYPSGKSCTYVDHVDVTVGYQNVVVYIADEIPPESCGFNEVMGHEQKHINVNINLLNDYVPRISTEVQDYLRLNGAFTEQNRDFALEQLHGKLQSIVKKVFSEMADENTSRQSEVDSPAEYRRVSSSCNGQLSDIAAHARPYGQRTFN